MNQPVAFVSYAWESAEHQTWVRTMLVDGLRERGVAALMDVYELRYGDDLDQFMADTIQKCDFVIVVCTPTYAERAKNFTGGVGKERICIERKFSAGGAAQHLIPVLRAGEPAESIPPFVGSSIYYADMRVDEAVVAALDELQGACYGRPVMQAPPVAPPPAWAVELLNEQDDRFHGPQDEAL